MAKNPSKQTIPTKKHLARLERERLQTRYILIGFTIVVLSVLGLVLYVILNQTILKNTRAVAVVNGERISSKDFQAQTRYTRYQVIQNALQTYQFASMFGNNPEMVSSFVGQLQQIEGQLEPEFLGEQVLNRMVENLLVRQEAARRGISVTSEEIEKGFEAGFGFFPNGTPTPTPTLEIAPTSTLSPLQLTLIPPTATATITPTATLSPTPTSTITATIQLTPSTIPTMTPTGEITPTLSPTPLPTPTPYTLEAYQKLYQDAIDSLKTDYQISEKDLQYVVESDIYHQKILETVIKDVPCKEEQVWAYHILVDDEALAKDIRKRILEGEDWAALATLYSKDTSNKDQAGDLGWFSRGAMVPEFEEAAFSLDIGEISEPVKTDFGWHIIRVIGHEDHPLSSEACDQLHNRKFQEFLDKLREDSKTEINEFWREVVPVDPQLPSQITNFIRSNLQITPTPPLIITPQP